MSGSIVERMVADYTPGTPHARATVTTAGGEVLTLPADMLGKFCWFQAAAGSGAAVDVAIRFAVSGSPAPVLLTRDALAGSTLTADPAVPHVLVPAGQTVRVRLDPTWTVMSHISGATTGALRFGLATGTG